MLFAAFALANRFLEEVVEEPVVEEVVETPVFRQPMFAPKPEPQPERVHTNMNKMTFSDYADVLQTAAEAIIATSAEEFLFDALWNPEVIHVSLADYPTTVMYPGQVVKHIWHDELCQRFIQYATICTPYGNIYITCDLNASGELSDRFTPVNVNYDSVELRERVISAARIHSYHFDRAEKFNPDSIQSTHSLSFFLGTKVSEGNIVQYLI